MMRDYKVGDKVKVTESVSTVNGTLYEDEVCSITGVTYMDKDLKLKDSMGRIWYVMDYQVKRV